MSWPTPKYSRSQVNHAGDVLVKEDVVEADDYDWAQRVLGNWRACHGYPINTFQATLREKLKHIDADAIVAQRLKRTPSILAKLKRFESMKLSRMQDIGGLRAVVSTLPQVRQLREDYTTSRFKHELVSVYDYIEKPKSDGYRSVHLVFRYKSDLDHKYDGLRVELQIRTRLQHAWATAVETMGTFLGQALKSRQGEQRWLSFFEITGSAFAHVERSSLIPGYELLSRYETFQRVATAEKELNVLSKLRGFTLAVDAITRERGTGSYHLVILDSGTKSVAIRPYAISRLDDAVAEYARVETRANAGEPIEAVLVSAGPIAGLRRAYPNYFLDTQDFIRRVNRIISEVERTPIKKRLRRATRLRRRRATS